MPEGYHVLRESTGLLDEWFHSIMLILVVFGGSFVFFIDFVLMALFGVRVKSDWVCWRL